MYALGVLRDDERMRLSSRVAGRTYCFRDLNDLLAKANRERSGDRLAGLAARSAQERVAARRLLAEVTLAELRARPALPPEHDEVSRVVEEGLDEAVHRRHRGMTVGELRDHVLGADPSELTAARLGAGLTPEMAAAVAKLCSNLDLVAGAARIPVVTRANTTLGLPGRLGVRLQPNHPTDDVEEILAQAREGLAFGCGDALIGVNPARDDDEVVRRLLHALDGLVREHRVPTQTCVLAHVSTQMRVLGTGTRPTVPMGLMFQSLAGTQSACRAFGIDVALLDEAAALARERCNVRGPHVMYFETGQGSELSSGCHEGIDQVTLEARCYGLARRYAPFLVNTVIGFIGPEYLFDASEVQRAGLEDHFMGKLLGLPMGVDACATNHMRSDHDDLENQAVLLAAAGANYFMGVPMGDDVLLGYRSTSFHDAATLRETLGRRPAPEFERWMERSGLMQDGRLTERAGDGGRLGPTARVRSRRATPARRYLARLGVGRAGSRPPLRASLEFAADLAAARDAVLERLPATLPRRLRATLVRSAARDDEEFLRDPAAGRRLARGEAARVRAAVPRSPAGATSVLPVVLSGLSAGAVAEQAGPVLTRLRRELAAHGQQLARPFLVERGRVKLADEIARLRGARIVVALVGDRPGLRTPRSLSAYVTERPSARTTDAERRMVSNIHARGLSPGRAARQISALVQQCLRERADRRPAIDKSRSTV